MQINWLFGLCALAWIVNGIFNSAKSLKGLVKKQPVIISGDQLTWVTGSYLVTLGAIIFFLFIDRIMINFDAILITIMVLLFLAFSAFFFYLIWVINTDYMIWGVYTDTFHAALTGALDKLNLPFKESPYSKSIIPFQYSLANIRLTDLEAELHIRMWSWKGIAHIRIEPRQYIHVIHQIARAMDEYYATTPVKPNKFSFFYYLINGIIWLLGSLFPLAIFLIPFFPPYNR